MDEREEIHNLKILRVSTFCVTLVLIICALEVTHESMAQDRRNAFDSYRETPNQTRNRSDSQVENLPDWAESRSPKTARDHREGRVGGEGMQTNVKDRPTPVPVDSGLIWLVVAGIGYGVFRLRGEAFPRALDSA